MYTCRFMRFSGDPKADALRNRPLRGIPTQRWLMVMSPLNKPLVLEGRPTWLGAYTQLEFLLRTTKTVCRYDESQT